MTPFQIVALSLLSLLFVATIVATVRGPATRREGFAWSSLWFITGVVVAWPDLTTRIAQVLGIGRGANLVLYCAVVTMLIGFFMVYARLRQLRREITLVVRHLAIRDATETPASRTPIPQGELPEDAGTSS